MLRAQHHHVFQNTSIRYTVYFNTHQGFKGVLVPLMHTAQTPGVMMNSHVLGITVCKIKPTFSNIYRESTFFSLLAHVALNCQEHMYFMLCLAIKAAEQKP